MAVLVNASNYCFQVSADSIPPTAHGPQPGPALPSAAQRGCSLRVCLLA
jgi:hypothetical protein